jgi:long-chain acyl-CoA synthetase
METLQEAEEMVMPAEAVSFPELFFKQVERKKDEVALRHKEYGIWKRISWKEYGTRAKEVAAALISSGLRHGDRVAILGDNCPEWRDLRGISYVCP